MTKLVPVVQFEIPGDPVGFYSMYGGKPNSKRKLRYLEFKKKVQTVVQKAKIQLSCPTKISPVLIDTVCYFRNGTHPDPENVHKGVKDALFYSIGGTKDKYTGGSYAPPKYDPKNPRVEVILTFL